MASPPSLRVGPGRPGPAGAADQGRVSGPTWRCEVFTVTPPWVPVSRALLTIEVSVRVPMLTWLIGRPSTAEVETAWALIRLRFPASLRTSPVAVFVVNDWTFPWTSIRADPAISG